jgi:hypothetical protein
MMIMDQDDLKMHGSMFVMLRKFLESHSAAATWSDICTACDLDPGYKMDHNYPVSDIETIISYAAQSLGISGNTFKENFGESLVPDLLRLYQFHVNPEWKTFEMLENTETVMHQAVRLEARNANPPVLNVTRVDDKLLYIDYYSRRRMASLAIGIIRGIAVHYNESDRVKIIPKSDPNDERVQIRIEFE